jgi:putative transposase
VPMVRTLRDVWPMESVFASLKVEHVHHCCFSTRAEAKAAVFDYIKVFYNRQRLHSALGYRTPVEARASTTWAVLPDLAEKSGTCTSAT